MDKTTLDRIFVLCLKTYECECGKNPENIQWHVTGWIWRKNYFIHHHGKQHIKVNPAIPLYLITKEELAAAINGLEYPADPPTNIEIIAAAHNLVIAYGASDDLMEFRGATYGEISCYGGGTALIDSQGLIPSRNEIDDDDEDALLNYLTRKKSAHPISAIWDSEGYSWVYKTTIPHATFEIIEDGDKYCRGIVFNLKVLEV